MAVLMTSLAEIRSFGPCHGGWKNILESRSESLTGKYDLEKQFPLVECMKSNSISDVCWLIGKRKKEIQICVRFARMCADSVQHLSNLYSRNAAAYAADDAYAAYAAAYAAAIYAADDAYADDAAYAYAAAAYAADAAAADDAAAYATAAYAADDAYAAYAAYAQKQKNRQFMIQCIDEFLAD